MHLASRIAWRQFERRTRKAPEANVATLRRILSANRATQIGHEHRFEQILRSRDLVGTFGERVPLSAYTDYHSAINRIAAGEQNILTKEPVRLFALSAGTTDTPKLIPRTPSAQLQHLQLVVLAEQAVINRDITGASSPRRGINLMSLHVPQQAATTGVPVMSGPNAGMARIRRAIPHLWTSPEAAFLIGDQLTALYLHALFGLYEREALYVETPFAHKLLGWFDLIASLWPQLVSDLRSGTLSEALKLTAEEREALGRYLVAQPARAAEVAAACRDERAGLARRLWPELRYLRTVTSGSFALSVPRLRWFAGPEVVIHSGCHSSSEGIIGINPRGDGTNEYVLACGAAYFEFLPSEHSDAAMAPTIPLEDLKTGADYEIVLTSSAGLYRYRLGDIVRITGHFGSAPLFEYRYRRGAILNLAGDKTTEFHTRQALSRATALCFDSPAVLQDYTTVADMEGNVGRYTFYLEFTANVTPTPDVVARLEHTLDRELACSNLFYARNGREPKRLLAPRIRVLKPGTFQELERTRMAVTPGLNAMQIKQSRIVTAPDQIQLLNDSCLAAK